jgi:hypothetical protein
MKSWSMTLLFGALLLGCQGYPPEGRVFYREGDNLEGTVSVIDNYPSENAVNIPVLSEVVIDFSAPLQRASVNLNRFRVEDEFGIAVPGRILFEENNRRLVFLPEYGGQSIPLESATNYTVHLQYLRDTSNRLIGSFSFKFRTQESAAQTGSFRIKEIYPRENLVFPNQTIAVQFSEAVAIPAGSTGCDCPQTNCNASWGDAFQILKVDLAEQAGVVSISGRICRQWNPSTSRWDLLQFVPDSSADFLTGLDYFDIIVRATGGLKGATSGEELAPGAYKQRRVWVIPTDYVFQYLQFNFF